MNKRKTNTNGALTKERFKVEVEQWGDRIGVEITEIHLRAMKHKWGSCSTNGG